MAYRVTTAWVDRHRQEKHVVIIDTRYDLLDKEAGGIAYAASHLPGAYYLSLSDDLSGPLQPDGAGGRHPLPAPEKLARILSRMGVTPDTTVIAYDDQGGSSASRLRWLLQWIGHRGEVVVLDGGYTAWVDAGLPVSTEVPANVEDMPYPVLIHDELWVNQAYVKSKIGVEGTVIIDSRDGTRYRGEQEPLDRVAGHIPGAINRFWTEGKHADGSWKSPEEQAERFAGLSKDDEIIVYCGSGVTATPNFFALQEAGFTNVKLYAGSWSDWSADERNPVATGEEV